jgi:hypothetical protein
MILDHALNANLLEDYHAEPTDKHPAGLVVEVGSLQSHLTVNLRNPHSLLCPVLGTLLLP